jgi:hypothetical protein
MHQAGSQVKIERNVHLMILFVVFRKRYHHHLGTAFVRNEHIEQQKQSLSGNSKMKFSFSFHFEFS